MKLNLNSHFYVCYLHYFPTPLLVFSSESSLGGPECLLVPAEEGENESRFFADPTDAFSGVPLIPNGLGSLDLAFAEFVDPIYLGAAGELARLSSSLTDDPPVLCLRYRSDRKLCMLIASSPPPLPPPLPLGVVLVALEGGVEGDFQIGTRHGFCMVGEGLLS